MTNQAPPRTNGFDRLRVRAGDAEPGHPVTPGSPATVGRDAEGKRALFSATGPEADVPAVGSVTIECSRCGDRTVMSPIAAVRAAFPSFLLSVTIGRGDRESTLGWLRRDHGAFMRCPACGRGSWTRLTIRL
jgi:ribosomal protein S27AE